MKNEVDNTYLNILKDILNNGVEKEDRTGTGTLSVFGRMIEFDMKNGFPLLTTKKMFIKGIITELLWFLNGETNIKNLVLNGNNIWVGDAYKKYSKTLERENEKNILTKEEFINKIKYDNDFSKKWGELGPIYGKQWVNWGGHDIVSGEIIDGLNKGINQIDNAIQTLKNNPNSRRIMVNSWNVADLDEMTLPPCHYNFQLYTRDLTDDERFNLLSDKEKENFLVATNPEVRYGEEVKYTLDNFYKHIPKKGLSLMWNQRSVDSFLGLPFNIASYGFLLHMIAQQVNMVPDKLIGSLGDVHLYKNHIDNAKIQIKREPKKLPKLFINKAKDIYSYTLNDFIIVDYDAHPTIKGDLSN